jgi:hypothetical protein
MGTGKVRSAENCLRKWATCPLRITKEKLICTNEHSRLLADVEP